MLAALWGSEHLLICTKHKVQMRLMLTTGSDELELTNSQYTPSSSAMFSIPFGVTQIIIPFSKWHLTNTRRCSFRFPCPTACHLLTQRYTTISAHHLYCQLITDTQTSISMNIAAKPESCISTDLPDIISLSSDHNEEQATNSPIYTATLVAFRPIQPSSSVFSCYEGQMVYCYCWRNLRKTICCLTTTENFTGSSFGLVYIVVTNNRGSSLEVWRGW